MSFDPATAPTGHILPSVSTHASPSPALTADNILLLKQAVLVLNSLDNERFARPMAQAYDATVGTHFRHCLNFYQSFETGFPIGRVDYDQRIRDLRMEQDRSYALIQYTNMIATLTRFAVYDPATSILVRQDTTLPANDPAAWGQSSLRRELQSLVSHTIHHFALIAIMLRWQGYEPPREFGVAPSTIQHWQRRENPPLNANAQVDAQADS